MPSKSFSCQGIVLKRKNWGEADRLVTVYTDSFGKVTAVAKGARRLSSSKRSLLEPGTQARFQFVTTRGFNLLTQSQLICSRPYLSTNLQTLVKAHQVLEIIDALTVEHEENEYVFEHLSAMLDQLAQAQVAKSVMLEQFRLLLQYLGFTHDKAFSETSLKEYIEELAAHSLRSKAYLTIGL
jgi:DNA repair protein RecO (recombination protein O)